MKVIAHCYDHSSLDCYTCPIWLARGSVTDASTTTMHIGADSISIAHTGTQSPLMRAIRADSSEAHFKIHAECTACSDVP